MALNITPDFSWFTGIFNGFELFDMGGVLGIVLVVLLSFAICPSKKMTPILLSLSLMFMASGIYINAYLVWLFVLLYAFEIVSLNQFVAIFKATNDAIGNVIGSTKVGRSMTNTHAKIQAKNLFLAQKDIEMADYRRDTEFDIRKRDANRDYAISQLFKEEKEEKPTYIFVNPTKKPKTEQTVDPNDIQVTTEGYIQ